MEETKTFGEFAISEEELQELKKWLFEEHSKNDVDLILEANFHKDEITKLYEIASKNNAEILTLVFEADIDVLYERFR